jgi:hypothetical protein
MRETFQGMLLTQQDDTVRAEIQTLRRDALPEGDVLVEVGVLQPEL